MEVLPCSRGKINELRKEIEHLIKNEYSDVLDVISYEDSFKIIKPQD